MDRRVLPIALVLLVLATIPQGAAVQLTFTETFEDDTSLAAPTNADYAFTSTNANTFVSTAAAHGGTKSLRVQVPATGANYVSFQFTNAAGCAASGPATATAAYTAWIKLDSLPASGTNDNLGTFASAGSGSMIFGIQINALGQVSVVGATATQSTGTTISTGVWTDFSWSASCTAQASAVQFGCGSSEVLQFSVCSPPTSGTSGGTSTTNFLNYKQGTASPFSRVTFIDDITVVSGSGSAALAFCADPNVLDYNGVAEADYGYDYRRGGDFFDQSTGDNPAGIGLSTGFDYSGGSNAEANWDYSAKHLSTGSKAMHENITIEADDQSQTTSNFRINFHTQLSSNPDATAKGNGLTTGHFADHVEVEWTESGSTWSIKFHYVNAGGTRTQIGSSFNFGDSHDATQFTAWLDTRATANLIATLDTNYPENWYQTSDVHADAFVAVTSASAGAGPGGERVALLAVRYLDDISGNPFVDDTIGDIWNVASGSLATGTAWHTAIDENDEGDGLASTCIFDDAGTAVFANSQGATPQNQIAPPAAPSEEDDGCTGPFCVNASTVPVGFTVTAFNGLLGLMFVGMVAVGGTTALLGENPAGRAVGMVFSVFAVIGYLIALMMDLVPLWPVIGLIVVGGAILFLKMRSG